MKKSPSEGRQYFEIGWREWVMLPDLGIATFRAKIDTGARSAALHALELETFEREATPWVRFVVPGNHHGRGPSYRCEAPLLEVRGVRNTSGVRESRLVVRTRLVLGASHWPIDVTLANRIEMGYRMILGRASLRRHHVVIHPDKSYLLGKPDPGAAGERAEQEKEAVP